MWTQLLPPCCCYGCERTSVTGGAFNAATLLQDERPALSPYVALECAINVRGIVTSVRGVMIKTWGNNLRNNFFVVKTLLIDIIIIKCELNGSPGTSVVHMKKIMK